MTKKINISEQRIIADIASPLRLAVVADLHNREGKRVAELVLSLAPDAVLIPGDLYETPPRRSYYAYEEALAFLEAVSPHIPVFYAPGNHDYKEPDDVVNKMHALGVTRLYNASVTWRDIHIGGVVSAQYVKGHEPNTMFIDAFSTLPGYKLLLCHHPEYFRHIRRTNIDLTVSGHAHGGQWRVFGRGIFSPGQGLFPKYTSGLYEGRLLVSRGLKISTPIPRFGNPREIVMLSLIPKNN